MNVNGNRKGRPLYKIDILPPDHPARFIAQPRRPDVSDAQFVTVGSVGFNEAPRCFTNDNHRASLKAEASAPGRIIAAERLLSRIPADFFSALVAVVFVLVFFLCGGFSFLFSVGAKEIAGPKLDITHVTMTPQDANGMRVLLINGIVENRTGASLPLPSIQAEFFSGDALLSTTLISPPSVSLDGGHSRGFSARVPHPGGKTPDLRIRLVEPEAS